MSLSEAKSTPSSRSSNGSLRRRIVREGPALLARVDSRGLWSPARHLDLVNQVLLEAVFGLGPPYVMILEPPRHGKSSLVSRRFPAWYLGLFPNRDVILASYEGDFAAEWGRKARDTLEEWGPKLFGVSVRQDSSAASRWQLEGYEGGMRTAGVGGAITGRGGHLLILDDPVKNAEHAVSEVYRQKSWDWWLSTFWTRREPGAVVVVVMTMWHPDDLGNRILARSPGWRVVRLPAIAEESDPEKGRLPDLLGRIPGEALWPERFPAEALEQIRREIGEHWWAALYQQRAVPRQGGMFERQWFEIVEASPADAQRVRYWDKAATEKRGTNDPDWTVGLKLVRTPSGIWYVEDVRRTRSASLEVERLIAQTLRLDGTPVPMWLEQEPGSSGKDVIAYYVRSYPGWTIEGHQPAGDKVLRADPVAAQAKAGNIKLVRGSWNQAFLDELEQFPFGAHDDQVDALSGAFARLVQDLYGPGTTNADFLTSTRV